MEDLSQNEMFFVNKQQKKYTDVVGKYTYFADDVLLAKVTPCFENGKLGIAKNLVNKIGFGSSEYYVIRPMDVVMNVWIYICMISDDFKKRGKANMTGTGGLQRIPKNFINTFKIPLPPLEIRQQIVEAIEVEQKAVEECKKLITIFEGKIKDKISEVWGE